MHHLASVKTKLKSLYIIVINIFFCMLYWSCGNSVIEEDTGVSNIMESPSIDPNQINRQVIGALFDAGNPNQICSVALIDPLHVISAAHCFNPSQPITSYQVIMESPVQIGREGISLATVILHPLWSGNVPVIDQHVQEIQSGQPSSLASKVWYDVAVARLAQPINTGSILSMGDLPVVGIPNVDVSYFSQGPNGIERLTGLLSVAHTNESSFTTISNAPITQSAGGGGAIISTPNSGGVLVGILSSTARGLGALFTRVGVHRRFIEDAMRGMISGDYTVVHSVNPMESDPNQPDPIEPRPTDTFDCTQESDRFCDSSCLNDIDCEMMNNVPRTGNPLGAPCNSGEDCFSRICLGVDEMRSICSEYCSNAVLCPRSFECVMSESGNRVCAPADLNQMNNGGNNDVPELLYFGADCTNDAECLSRTCITHGGRKWCSERCMMDNDCSVGYTCTQIAGTRACTPPT